MTGEEILHYNTIDTLIRQDRSFAIWRIPGDTLRFAMQSSGSARLFYHIEELDEQCGYVIAPFQPSAQLPIVLIQPDCELLVPALDAETQKHLHNQWNRETDCSFAIPPRTREQGSYMQAFDRFISPLREKTFDKLVLSRSQTLQRDAEFSASAAFFKACRQYPYSYVYLCHTPQTGTWLGSTPEIILSGQNGAWQTVALAGTQPLHDGKLPTEWDDKNRREQALVAGYIRQQLTNLGIQPEESEPHPVRAGALSHLKSDFSFSIPDHKRLGDLLRRLHPTPAVCGLPKEESYRFILENEGYDRRYYSGFIGWIDPERRSDLYVNLRCMNIHPDRFTLYAGGGLLASSEPESEWQETEAKMQTMKKLIEF